MPPAAGSWAVTLRSVCLAADSRRVITTQVGEDDNSPEERPVRLYADPHMRSYADTARRSLGGPVAAAAARGAARRISLPARPVRLQQAAARCPAAAKAGHPLPG